MRTEVLRISLPILMQIGDDLFVIGDLPQEIVFSLEEIIIS